MVVENQGFSGKGFAFPWTTFNVGLVLLIILALMAAGFGSVSIPPLTVLEILASKIPGLNVTFDGPETFDVILTQLRFPRGVLAGLVGGALSISGGT